MPYNLKERRPAIIENPLKCQDEGDLTFAFAHFFWLKWNRKDAQRWATYHKFRKMIKNPGTDTDFQDLHYKLSALLSFSKLDVDVAAETALDEFFRRVMVKYEQGKIQANGDVFTLVPAAVKEKAPVGFQAEVKNG